MAIERIWERVTPIEFTVDGGADGLVTIRSTEMFKVRQKIVISSNAKSDMVLQIKKVISYTQLLVGPVKNKVSPKNNLLSREDISTYLVADSAAIRATEQNKSKITSEDIIQAIYDQEPTLALRSFLVDYLGRGYGVDNPLPVANSSIDKYVIHNIDEPTNTTTYIGKETATGTWLIQFLLEVGKTTTITYANVSNNPLVSNYGDAWSNRLTLNYNLIENLQDI